MLCSFLHNQAWTEVLKILLVDERGRVVTATSDRVPEGQVGPFFKIHLLFRSVCNTLFDNYLRKYVIIIRNYSFSFISLILEIEF